ncbi:hypothetical protein SAMN05216361_0146 [Marisediminitalea aggregata]|uniref:Tissue inhibitor of metalloproteinase n=1 Tax=Marisediminitalea aggregata TaxID=634436 RepID=A0A1M5T1X4_9ALTE|nr:hypothetical protein SAMN05216361_0146 [Marisediminitalea aggregata]
MRNLLVILSFFYTTCSSAVCLSDRPNVKNEYENNESVFVGKVVDEAYLSDDQGFYTALLYSIKVQYIYKGKLSGILVAFNNMDSGRFPMDVGKEYLIFTNASYSPIIISSCGNSKEVSNATETIEEVKKLASKDV